MNREEKVAVFNKIMGQPVGIDPKSVPLKLRQLAIRLIFEELRELAEASGVKQTFVLLCNPVSEKGFTASEVDGDVKDQVLQLDGLADVQYTLSWAVNVLGYPEVFQAAFEEACRSNDSKACTTPEEAEQTKAYWENENNPEAGGEHFIDPVVTDGITYYVVKRKSDEKVRKSISYSPANFAQFIK